MDYEFRPESTPVLHFKLKSHVPYKHLFWLLWPVYAYRVIAPLPSSNASLNIFQKAVLGFCRIQHPDPVLISQYLHLDPELIEFILAELHQMNLIDAGFRITAKGQSYLDGEEESFLSEILTGYVFQDPWTKQLWPRVVDKLSFAPVEYQGKDTFPTLLLGTAGNVKEYQPFVKRADFNAGWQTPSVQEILSASFRHQRDIKRISSFSEEPIVEDEAGVGSYTELSYPSIKKVALISEEPEPYYLTTYLYKTSSDAPTDELFACDPFGLGASTDLMCWVSDLMQRDGLLKERIGQWLKPARANHSNTNDTYSDLARMAKSQIKDRFSEIVGMMPFYPQILELVSSQLEVARVDDPPLGKLRDILLKSAILLEAVLEHVRERFTASGSTGIYNTKDWRFRQELLTDIAGQIGFHVPAPRGFASIEPRKILRVESGGGTLGERMVVSLLAARVRLDHPFWQAATVMPDLLNTVSDLSYVRGQSSHFTDYIPSKQDVSKYVEIALNVTEIIGIAPIMNEENNDGQKK
jgi:hypothetical protein